MTRLAILYAKDPVCLFAKTRLHTTSKTKGIAMLTQTRLGGSLSCLARTESVGVHPGKQAAGDIAGKRVHRGIDFTGDGRLKEQKRSMQLTRGQRREQLPPTGKGDMRTELGELEEGSVKFWIRPRRWGNKRGCDRLQSRVMLLGHRSRDIRLCLSLPPAISPLSRPAWQSQREAICLMGLRNGICTPQAQLPEHSVDGWI